MKHGKKPTMAQKKLMAKIHLNCDDWLVSQDTSSFVVFVHRLDGHSKTYLKLGGQA